MYFPFYRHEADLAYLAVVATSVCVTHHLSPRDFPRTFQRHAMTIDVRRVLLRIEQDVDVHYRDYMKEV
jgi:hypothetical protein